MWINSSENKSYSVVRKNSGMECILCSNHGIGLVVQQPVKEAEVSSLTPPDQSTIEIRT